MGKLTYLMLLFCVMLTGCKSDYSDFSDTKNILETDKKIYQTGDNIEISLAIYGTDKGQAIQYYENLKNFELSFSLVNDKENIYNGSWSARSGNQLPKSKILEETVTSDKPFIIKLTGKISIINNHIQLEFPKLNYTAQFKRDIALQPETYVRVHCFLNPINPPIGSALESYTNIEDIKIRP